MWLDTPWMAAITALVLWWAATGVLLWRVHAADRGGPGAHVMSVILFLPLLVGGLIGAHGAAADPSPQGAYVGFLAALAIWAWIELAFLSGVITGPNTDPCPRSLRGWPRFRAAFLTIAWHEAALLVALGTLWAMTSGQPNSFAFWTFLLLFGARISAKLNLFLGVPRINTDFLPQPLAHLSGYFRQGPVSGFFPLSVTVLAATLGCFIERLWSAATPGAVVGFTLLTALCALALLEHWFMVWRLRDDKLWRWAVPASSATTDSLRGQTHGL
jgi:putative photosynthetic complex assembly protein 2